MKKILISAVVFLLSVSAVIAQTDKTEKAEAVLKKAVENLGGEKYLNVKTQVGKGKYSQMRDRQVILFQSFLDVIVYPDKERTEFKGGGSRIVQTNFADAGWIFDGDLETITEQSEAQVSNFKRAIRVSLDNLLRGGWRAEEGAEIKFAGRRQAGIGRSNDVVKLIYKDGFEVEFEFSDDGMPVKSIYKRENSEGETVAEENRYAQFVDVGGIKTPFIIDRYTGGAHTSRINYESVEYNRKISDSIFEKPSNPKSLKKDLKL